MSEEYIMDMKIRCVNLAYEYWELKVQTAKIELETAQKRKDRR